MIRSITRILCNNDLIPILKLLRGNILDIGCGAKTYKEFLDENTQYTSLDIDTTCNPDICIDVTNKKSISVLKRKKLIGTFDAVLAIHVLEHVAEPKIAIDTIYSLLKKNGTCIIAVPYMYKYHPCPKDYYRYTKDGLKYLLKEFDDVKVISHGNKFLCMWLLISSIEYKLPRDILKKLNPLFAKCNWQDELCPLGYVVVAKK